MLYSVVIELSDEKKYLNKDFDQHKIYAWFLEVISKLDEQMAETLYKENIKRFTISSFFNEKKEGSSRLRITFLDNELYKNFVASFLTEKTVKIENKEFEVMTFMMGQNPMSRYSRIEDEKDILNKNINNQSRTVRFLSPTFFKRNGKNIVLPEPENFFKSVFRKYKEVFEENIEEETLNEISEKIMISNMLVRTRTKNLKKIEFIGFTGKVVYDFSTLEKTERTLMNRLVNIAFYTGVGAKTAFGFGQVYV